VEYRGAVSGLQAPLPLGCTVYSNQRLRLAIHAACVCVCICILLKYEYHLCLSLRDSVGSLRTLQHTATHCNTLQRGRLLPHAADLVWFDVV